VSKRNGTRTSTRGRGPPGFHARHGPGPGPPRQRPRSPAPTPLRIPATHSYQASPRAPHRPVVVRSSSDESNKTGTIGSAVALALLLPQRPCREGPRSRGALCRPTAGRCFRTDPLGAQVEKVIAKVDRSTMRGCPDFAVLLVLPRSGLRASEAIAPELEDIRSSAAAIAVRGKDHFHDRPEPLADGEQALASDRRTARGPSRARRMLPIVQAPRVDIVCPSIPLPAESPHGSSYQGCRGWLEADAAGSWCGASGRERRTADIVRPLDRLRHARIPAWTVAAGTCDAVLRRIEPTRVGSPRPMSVVMDVSRARGGAAHGDQPRRLPRAQE